MRIEAGVGFKNPRLDSLEWRATFNCLSPAAAAADAAAAAAAYVF